MSSAILSADDLNDFISPGVACIKPVETLPASQDANYNPYEVTTEDKVAQANPAPASISLTDCLACSGCVTSAEAVLVSLQSHNEVLNTLDSCPNYDVCARLRDADSYNAPENSKVFVASVSPQVRASIAATYGMSLRRAGNLIEQLLAGPGGLKSGGQLNTGFSYVFDTNRLRQACLVLGAEEVKASIQNKARPKPVITSACPGWICYAEKTHPHILPHLSGLKSPQALTGTLVKSILSKRLNIPPSQIWHLAVMPCFDKKLEASRAELMSDHWHKFQAGEPVRDVDCVITSRELLTLASARNISLHNLPTTRLSNQDYIPFPDSQIEHFLHPPSSSNSSNPKSALKRTASEAFAEGSSGGYLHHVLQTIQSHHTGSRISVQKGRNADVTEYTLLSSSGHSIMKCARYYGFRNIQNLVRKLQPAKVSKMPGAAARKGIASRRGEGSEYSYVEVMACPGGCTNGGGQIRLEDVKELLPETRGEVVTNSTGSANAVVAQKEWLGRVDEAYFSAESDEDEEGDVRLKDELGNGMMNGHTESDVPHIVNGIDTAEVHDMLHHWSRVVDIPTETLCFTTYREVVSDIGKKPKDMTDSERIAKIAGLSGGGW